MDKEKEMLNIVRASKTELQYYLLTLINIAEIAEKAKEKEMLELKTTCLIGSNENMGMF